VPFATLAPRHRLFTTFQPLSSVVLGPAPHPRQAVSLRTCQDFVDAEVVFGLNGIIIETGPEPALEVILTSTTSIDDSRRSEGILRIEGAWMDRASVLRMDVRLSSAREVQQLKEQLLNILRAFVMNLHSSAKADAPLLSLTPTVEAAVRGEPADLGAFCCSGYVLLSTRGGPVRLPPREAPPECSLYWAELYGPGEDYCVKLLFFSSHKPDATFMDWTSFPTTWESFRLFEHVLVLRGEEPLGGACGDWEVPADWCITFRASKEAQLWVDFACAAARNSPPPTAAAVRARSVTSELRRLMGHPEEPGDGPALDDVVPAERSHSPARWFLAVLRASFAGILNVLFATREGATRCIIQPHRRQDSCAAGRL